MVYLVKDNNNVKIFYSENEMKAAGFVKANLIVDEERFNANGCYTRIIDGKIIVGKTEAEIAEETKQEQITECLEQLEEIDRESGAGRHVRDISISAGDVLDAVRILLARFAKELNINLPNDFGSGINSAAEILNLAPPANATTDEKANFAVFKSLLIVSHYDPAINLGLSKIREAEAVAVPIRAKLAELAG